MRKLKYLICLFCLLVVGCQSSTILVTFVLNGGSLNNNSEEVQTYTLSDNGTYQFANILIPKKEGEIFTAWFLDAKLTKYFDMTNVNVKKSLKLYAGYVEDCFEFLLNEQGSIDIGYKTTSDTPIPSYLLGRPVKGILANGLEKTSLTSIDFTKNLISTFKTNSFTNTNVTTITIGGNIETIEDDAFYQADNLKKISTYGNPQFFVSNGYFFSRLADNTYRLIYAFAPTTVSQDGIDISNLTFTISQIGPHAFKNIKVDSETLGGYKVYLPSGLVEISDYAFEDFQVYRASDGKIMQTMAIIPKSVQRIGKYAFANSSFNLIAFTSNSNLKIIDDYAFFNTPLNRIFTITEVTNTYTSGQLKLKINIDGNTKFPGKGVLTYKDQTYQLANQEEVLLDVNSTDYIINYVFYVKEGIKAADLSLSIGNNNGLFRIQGISTRVYLSYLPSNVEFVGYRAFSHTKLADLYLANPLTLSEKAFEDTSSVKVYLPQIAEELALKLQEQAVNYTFY